MLLLNNNIKILTYLTIYNYTLIALFWIFYSKNVLNHKTLNSLSLYKFDSYNVFSITLLLLSLAGVPPLLGFFTKIFIILLILNNNFFIFFIFFLIFTLISLYFYLQNIRYIHSSKNETFSTTSVNYNIFVSVNFYNITILISFLITFGIFFIDDIMLFLFWLLI